MSARLMFVPLFVLACSSSDPPAMQPGPLRVVADETQSGGVGLEPRIEQDQLVVDVVARDVPPLSGVAIRLEHPTWVTFERRDVAPGFGENGVHLSKVVSPSEISVVESVKGQSQGRAGGVKITLCTLHFKIQNAPAAGDLGALRIVPLRSELRNDTGSVLPARFAGASFMR